MLLAVSTMFLVVVAQAQAQQADPSPSASAIDAYVETMPSASGVSQYVEAVPTRTGQSAPGAPNVSSAPAEDGSAVADALKTIVESPRYGAGASASSVPDVPPNADANPALTTSLSGSFRSALGAIGTSSDARLLGVLLVVLATTVAATVLAIRRGPN